LILSAESLETLSNKIKTSIEEKRLMQKLKKLLPPYLTSIDGMANWSKENHMRLNIIKTQHMVISNKQQQSTQQLTTTLNDIDLKRVEKYEYLGVVLNNSINYVAQ
jgi:hypothetical protein